MKLLDARQDAKLKMYKGVVKCCEDNSTVIVTHVAFNDAVQEFVGIVVLIDSGSQNISLDVTGITAAKTFTKKDVSEDTATMAGRIYAFAAKTGNIALKQSVDLSASDLLRLKDSELAPACQAIHDLALANKTALANYGVTDAKLAALQSKIDGYAQSVPTSRSAITQRKVTKAQVKEWFKQADAILTEQMDKLIDDFKPDHPRFVADYKAARVIVDPKSKPTEPTVEGTGGNPPA